MHWTCASAGLLDQKRPAGALLGQGLVPGSAARNSHAVEVLLPGRAIYGDELVGREGTAPYALDGHDRHYVFAAGGACTAALLVYPPPSTTLLRNARVFGAGLKGLERSELTVQITLPCNSRRFWRRRYERPLPEVRAVCSLRQNLRELQGKSDLNSQFGPLQTLKPGAEHPSIPEKRR